MNPWRLLKKSLFVQTNDSETKTYSLNSDKYRKKKEHPSPHDWNAGTCVVWYILQEKFKARLILQYLEILIYPANANTFFAPSNVVIKHWDKDVTKAGFLQFT